MSEEVYTFGNGVRVYRDLLLDIQISRYTAEGNPNLHEPIEEGWFCNALKEAPDTCTFVDIGAGIGYYSILAKILKPNTNVLAMEPLPRHLDALKRNLVLNNIDPQDVRLIPKAISASGGLVRFVDLGYGSQIDRKIRPGINITFEVHSISLEEMAHQASGRINLMKMDIQGEEINVFRGSEAVLSSGQIGTIIIGTHGAAIHAELKHLLGSVGTVLFDDPVPDHQPDGILVAKFDR